MGLRLILNNYASLDKHNAGKGVMFYDQSTFTYEISV